MIPEKDKNMGSIKYTESILEQVDPQFLNPKNIDGEEYYVVEKIINKKVVGSHTYYLVKWVGWPVETSTWEPKENLKHIAPTLLRQYNINEKRNKTEDIVVRKRRLKQNASHMINSLIPPPEREKVVAGTNPFVDSDQLGHFLYGDEPLQILRVEKSFKGETPTEQNKQILFEIEWKAREGTSIQPKNTMVSYDDMFRYCPHFLINFLIDHTVLVPKSEGKSGKAQTIKDRQQKPLSKVKFGRGKYPRKSKIHKETDRNNS